MNYIPFHPMFPILLEYKCDDLVKSKIYQRQKNRNDAGHHYHDDSSFLQICLIRPSYAFYLGTNVPKKTTNLLELHFFVSIYLFCNREIAFSTNLNRIRLGYNVAGQAGIEPATPGFGDRCSTS